MIGKTILHYRILEELGEGGMGVVYKAEDIKPANILLTEKGQVRITDFGLAKLVGRTQLTREGTSLGTVAYMCPEQMQGIAVDHRTDIWALGVVIYEMVTGKQPFAGDYEQAVMYSTMNEDPEPPTALRTVPMELERIVLKAVAKEPEGRYQNLADMLVDLKALQESGLTHSKAVRKTPKQISFNITRIYSGLTILLLLSLGALAYFFTRSQPIDSIAVLPFINSDNDPDIEYLSDGITETLITKLSQLPQLRVMARSTVFRFKGKNMTPQQVGEQLNVRAVLLGEVVQRGEALRLVAELVEVSDGAQIWGDQYNRRLDDIFAVQDAISEQISTSLRLKLSSSDKHRLVKRHTEDTVAYQLYLKGRFYMSKRRSEALKTALGYFQQAVDRDPTYALAYAGIADCHVLLPFYSGLSAKESNPKAKAAALQALQIDDNSRRLILHWL